MRVLVVTPSRFFANYGHPIRVLGEVAALSRIGVEVTVCAYGHGENIPGLTIRRVGWTPRQLKSGWHPARMYLDPLLGVAAAREALRRPYDLIHAHIFDGAAAALIPKLVTGVPLVADLQDSASELLDSSGHSKLLVQTARVVERIVAATADHILTSSSRLASLVIERFGLPSNRVTPLVDAVDTDLYHPLRWQAERILTRTAVRIPEGRSIIVYAGSLTERQGVGTLLALMRRPNLVAHGCHFLILGSGESRYEAEIQNLTKEGNVTFLGDVPYHEVPRFLATADVGISTKGATSEGNGKLLHYMAMALPTIAADTATNRELLGAYGIYVTCGNLEEWSQAILALSRERRRRAVVSEKLRERVIEHFSWKVRVRNLLEVYERIRHRSGAKSRVHQQLSDQLELPVPAGEVPNR